MPDFRIPPEGIEIEGLVWPGNAEISVTDAYWANRLKEAGAEMTHDGGISLATPPAADGEGEDWLHPLPPEVTEWDKPKPPETAKATGEGEPAETDGEGEPADAGETDDAGEAGKTKPEPADTGNKRRAGAGK